MQKRSCFISRGALALIILLFCFQNLSCAASPEKNGSASESSRSEFSDPGVSDFGVSEPSATESGTADFGVSDPGVSEEGATDPEAPDPNLAPPPSEESLPEENSSQGSPEPLNIAAVGYSGDTETSLTFVSWGGTYAKSQQGAFLEPYQKEGHAISMRTYDGSLERIRSMIMERTVSWDVVDADAYRAVMGCKQGLFKKIDWSRLGISPDIFENGKLTSCTIPHVILANVLVYDSDRFPYAPTTLSALFDLERFPGRRGLHRSPTVNLEWALIADGVDPKEVYKVLRTPQGIDRAFKKLDTIKKFVVWWETGSEPQELLMRKDVVLSSAWNGRIYAAQKTVAPNLQIIWDKAALDYNYWVIVEGTPREAEAYDFIKFSSTPARMADQTNRIAYSPANKEALPLVDKAVLPYLPTSPQNREKSFTLDPFFWGEYGYVLGERFEAWITEEFEEE